MDLTEKVLIVLLGPTGVGKTALSIEIAKRYGAEIFSSDSRQFYKDLPIGTAAPTAQELAQVPHHLIGVFDLDYSFSAGRYEELVIGQLESYFQTHMVGMLCGGSMMYIDAVCKGIDELPNVDPKLRMELTARFEQEGLDTLCNELRLLDPVYYNQVDLKNPKRVIHALEMCYQTGRPFSELRTRPVKQRPFRIIKIGLTRPREELYERINLRVEQMMEQGLEQEARKALSHRNCNALKTVGYKEMFAYFDGLLTKEEAIEKIKQNSRIYSRKQMTWFKRDKDIKWFNPDDQEEIFKYLDAMMEYVI